MGNIWICVIILCVGEGVGGIWRGGGGGGRGRLLASVNDFFLEYMNKKHHCVECVCFGAVLSVV